MNGRHPSDPNVRENDTPRERLDQYIRGGWTMEDAVNQLAIDFPGHLHTEILDQITNPNNPLGSPRYVLRPAVVGGAPIGGDPNEGWQGQPRGNDDEDDDYYEPDPYHEDVGGPVEGGDEETEEGEEEDELYNEEEGGQGGEGVEDEEGSSPYSNDPEDPNYLKFQEAPPGANPPQIGPHGVLGQMWNFPNEPRLADTQPIDLASIGIGAPRPQHLVQLRQAVRDAASNPERGNPLETQDTPPSHRPLRPTAGGGARAGQRGRDNHGNGFGNGPITNQNSTMNPIAPDFVPPCGRGRSRSNDLMAPSLAIPGDNSSAPVSGPSTPGGRGCSQSVDMWTTPPEGLGNTSSPHASGATTPTGQGTRRYPGVFNSPGPRRGTISTPPTNRGHSHSPFAAMNDLRPGTLGNSPWGPPPRRRTAGASNNTPFNPAAPPGPLPAIAGSLPDQPIFATPVQPPAATGDPPSTGNPAVPAVPITAGLPGTFAALNPDLSDVDIQQALLLHVLNMDARLGTLERSHATLAANLTHHTAIYRSDQAVLLPALQQFARAAQDQHTFTRATLTGQEAQRAWRRNMDRSMRGHRRAERSLSDMYALLNQHQAELERGMIRLADESEELGGHVQHVRVDVRELRIGVEELRGLHRDLVRHLGRFVGAWEVESSFMQANQMMILAMVSWLEPVAICFQFFGWVLGLFAFWRWGRTEDARRPPHEMAPRGPQGPPPPPSPPLADGNQAGRAPPPGGPGGGGGGDDPDDGGGDGGGGDGDGGGEGGDGDNGGNEGGDGGGRNGGAAGDQQPPDQPAELDAPGPAGGQTAAQAAAQAAILRAAAQQAALDQAASGPSIPTQQPPAVPLPGHVGSPFRPDGLPWETYNRPVDRRPSDPDYEPPTPLFANQNREQSRTGIEVFVQRDQRAIATAGASRGRAKNTLISLFLLLALALNIYWFIYPDSFNYRVLYGGAAPAEMTTGAGYAMMAWPNGYTRGEKPGRGAWLDEPVMRALFGAQKEARTISSLASQSAESALACAKLVHEKDGNSATTKAKEDWHGKATDTQGKCKRAVELGAEVSEKMSALAGRLEWVFGERWWGTLTGEERRGWRTVLAEAEGKAGEITVTTDVARKTGTAG